MATEVRIGGVDYQVVSARAFEFNGKSREFLKLRRAKGSRFYFATRYENGSFSEAV